MFSPISDNVVPCKLMWSMVVGFDSQGPRTAQSWAVIFNIQYKRNKGSPADWLNLL